VLGPLEKGLRSAAELGAWQLISPVDARGRVLLVDGLHEIQDEVRAMCLIPSLPSNAMRNAHSAIIPSTCMRPWLSGTPPVLLALCSAPGPCLAAQYQPRRLLPRPTIFPCKGCRAPARHVLCPAAQTYGEPTVIVAQRVTGEEEVPEGAVAVLTPDAPDVLSHVSVRARNMRVLFAICHDAEELARVCGRIVQFAVACCTYDAAAGSHLAELHAAASI
jgi:hypothetical protein